MKSLLSCADTFKIFEMLLKHPLSDQVAQESILAKLRLNLTDHLEKQDALNKADDYRSWRASEERRIDELKKAVQNIVTPIPQKTQDES